MATPTTQPGAPQTPATNKPSGNNAYNWMLILAFVFLTVGCLFLLLELSRYDFATKPV